MNVFFFRNAVKRMNESAQQEYLDKDSERKTNERAKESEDSTKL